MGYNRNIISAVYPQFKMVCGIALLSLPLMTGCGSSNLPCVKAKVTLAVDGKPYGPATATFYRQGAKPQERATVGNIERNGEGTLSTYRMNDGIPEGEYVVTVATGGLGKTPVAKTYADQSKSPLKITVFKNSDVIKLDLEPVKSSGRDGNPLDKLGAKAVEDIVGDAMQPK